MRCNRELRTGGLAFFRVSWEGGPWDDFFRRGEGRSKGRIGEGGEWARGCQSSGWGMVSGADQSHQRLDGRNKLFLKRSKLPPGSPKKGVQQGGGVSREKEKRRGGETKNHGPENGGRGFSSGYAKGLRKKVRVGSEED